jgi:hypothetical protein
MMAKSQRRGILRGWVLADVILGAFAGVLLLLDLSIFLAGTLPSISIPLAAMIAGIGTLALAALTGVIIVFNAGVLDATRQAAEATKAEADATHKEAVATREQAEATKEQSKVANESLRELRYSRELEWRPILVKVAGKGGIGHGRSFRDAEIRNIGRGPALNAIYLREEEGIGSPRFLMFGPRDIAAGQELNVRAEEQNEPPHPALFHRREIPRELLICQDQFGNSFRFVPGFPEPVVWTREDDEQGLPAEPGWIRGMKEILFARRPQVDEDPDSAYAFTQATWTQGNFSYSHSTVAVEAVPPNDLTPDDTTRATIDSWMRSVNPQFVATSMAAARWEAGTLVNADVTWYGELSAGPTIVVRAPIDSEALPLVGDDDFEQPRGNLLLPNLIALWKEILQKELEVAKQLGVPRVRFGLTMVPSGAPRIVGVNFGDLPAPPVFAPAPAHEIRAWSYRSLSFEGNSWPAVELEAAIRQVLRIFGYVQVDELITAMALGDSQASTSGQ